MSLRLRPMTPPRWLTSKLYPQDAGVEGVQGALAIQDSRLYAPPQLTEAVQVTPGYQGMSLTKVVAYKTYDNGEPEAVQVTPGYVSMALPTVVAYVTYNNAAPEAVKVTPGYQGMSLQVVVNYITYNNAEPEAVKVTPGYVGMSLTTV